MYDQHFRPIDEPSGLTVTETRRPGGIRVLTLVGDIDAATVDQLAAAVATGDRLMIDLSRVGFLGCCGVRCLCEANERAAGLVVVAGGHAVARSLATTGADRFLTVRDRPADAFAQLSTIAPSAATPNSSQAT